MSVGVSSISFNAGHRTHVSRLWYTMDLNISSSSAQTARSCPDYSATPRGFCPSFLSRTKETVVHEENASHTSLMLLRDFEPYPCTMRTWRWCYLMLLRRSATWD